MPDYDDAAQRHWKDANYLLGGTFLPNADQLFGLSAECALKTIMLALGMPMKNNKPENKKHGHINVFWDEFISFPNTRNQTQYPTFLATNNPFDQWRVDQRYENGSAITMQMVIKHQAAAQQARNCLGQAVLDGLVP